MRILVQVVVVGRGAVAGFRSVRLVGGFSSRGPGGGRFFARPVSHTDGSVNWDHATKARFLNESTRGLFVNYMRERADYGR